MREKDKVSTSKCVSRYSRSFVDELLFLLSSNWTMDIIYKSIHFDCEQHQINEQKKIKLYSWNGHLIKTKNRFCCSCCTEHGRSPFVGDDTEVFRSALVFCFQVKLYCIPMRIKFQTRELWHVVPSISFSSTAINLIALSQMLCECARCKS